MKIKYVTVLFLSIFLVVIGFNTIDQMIIRYKYYDYWRSVEHWTMCYFWSPHWWDIYIFSVISIWISGFLIGLLIMVYKNGGKDK